MIVCLYGAITRSPALAPTPGYGASRPVIRTLSAYLPVLESLEPAGVRVHHAEVLAGTVTRAGSQEPDTLQMPPRREHFLRDHLGVDSGCLEHAVAVAGLQVTGQLPPGHGELDQGIGEVVLELRRREAEEVAELRGEGLGLGARDVLQGKFKLRTILSALKVAADQRQLQERQELRVAFVVFHGEPPQDVRGREVLFAREDGPWQTTRAASRSDWLSCWQASRRSP